MTHSRLLELLSKEFSDQLTGSEREELDALLAANADFRQERELLAAFWQREAGEYAASKALFARVQEKIAALEEPVVLRPRRRVLGWAAAAAVVVGALVVGGLYYHGNRGAAASQPVAAVHWLRKTTLPRQKDSVLLADGTLVRLNSASTLIYPDRFTDSVRQVQLDGEAFFDVSKEAARPFLIAADKMNIRVLGTSFDVKSYKNEAVAEATLIQGSIEVTLTDRPDRFILKPKEKFVVENKPAAKRSTDSLVARSTHYTRTSLTYYPNPARTIVETGWLENKLVFSGKDFSDLTGELQRWYGVRIEFKSEHAKHYVFSGILEKESLEEALDALKMIEPFKYETKDSTVYIY